MVTELARHCWRQFHREYARWQRHYEVWVETHPALPAAFPVGPRALTRALMAHHEAEQAVLAERPRFPDVCRDLTCGAKTRQGTPCKRRDLNGLGARCRLHGGQSTGPRTVAGKQRAALNGLHPKRKRTP